MYTIKYGSNWLHNPTSEQAILSSASLTFGENSFSYCDFEIQAAHPLYNTIKEKDYTHPVRIYEDDTLLFSGYIDSISKDFSLVKTCKCVTELAYLQDSVVRPYSTMKNNIGSNVANTFEDYFVWLIQQHNKQVEDKKRFTIGINEGDFFEYYNNYYVSSLDYPSTWDEIEEKIIDNAGAYIRIRYEGNTRYIDLLYQWLDANKQTIELGKNLLDLTVDYDSENLATCVIPTGASLSETGYYYDNGYFKTKDTKAQAQEDTIHGLAEIKQYYYKSRDTYLPVVTSSGLTLRYFKKTEIDNRGHYDPVKDTNKKPDPHSVYCTRRVYPNGSSDYHVCSDLADFNFYERQAKYTEVAETTETHYGRTLYYRKNVKINGEINYIYNSVTLDKDTPIEFYGQKINESQGQYWKVPIKSTIFEKEYNYFVLSGYETKDGKKEPKYTKVEGISILCLFKLEEDFIVTYDAHAHPLSKRYYYQSGDSNTYSEVNTTVGEPLTIYIQVKEEDKDNSFVPINNKVLDKGNIYCVRYKDLAGIISYQTLDGISDLNIYEYDELKNKGELPLTIEGELEIVERDGFTIEKDMIKCTEAVAKYGIIQKHLDFSDLVSKADLYRYGVKALKQMISPRETLQVKAIDMHFINPSNKSIRVGEYVRCTSKMHDIDQYLLCSAIDMDLVDPRYTTYTLGTTYDTLTGESNQRMKDLNATINTTYKTVAAISSNAQQQATEANTSASRASTAAAEAITTASKASSVATVAQGTAIAAASQANTANQVAEVAKQQADKAISASNAVKNEVDDYKRIMGTLDSNLEYSYNLRFEKDPYYAPYVYKMHNDSDEAETVDSSPTLYSNKFKILPIGGNGVLYSSCCEITEITPPSGITMTVHHISNNHLEIHDSDFNTVYSSEQTYYNDEVTMSLKSINYDIPYSESFTVKGICHFVDCSAGYDKVDKWSVIDIPFVVESKAEYAIVKNEDDIEFIEVSNEASDDPTKDYTDINKSVDTTGNIREIMDQVEIIVRNEIAKYLPLTGGQLSGDLVVNGSTNVTDKVTANTVTAKQVNADTIIVGNHSSGIGSMKTVYSTVGSLPSGTYTSIASITLTTGYWIIFGNTRFAAKSGSRVCGNIADKAGAATPVVTLMAAPSATSVTVIRPTKVKAAETTYYFNIYHNGGSTITKRDDYNSALNDGLTAIRIA